MSSWLYIYCSGHSNILIKCCVTNLAGCSNTHPATLPSCQSDEACTGESISQFFQVSQAQQQQRKVWKNKLCWSVCFSSFHTYEGQTKSLVSMYLALTLFFVCVNLIYHFSLLCLHEIIEILRWVFMARINMAEVGLIRTEQRQDPAKHREKTNWAFDRKF